jgi:hypothetical protein
LESAKLLAVSKRYQSMFDVLSDFEWLRDKKGYRVAPFKSLSKRWRELKAEHVDWIVPRGGRNDAIKYRPFAGGGDLCTAFASVRTPDQLLDFINIHGLLTWSVGQIPNDTFFADFPAGEPVRLGLAQAEMFRELLSLRALGNLQNLASHFQAKIAGFVGGGQVGQVEVLPDPERGIRLKIRPPTLIGALWYQLALKLSEATLRMCPLCHRVFEVGRGTGRRADAKFCCIEHKAEFFNRSRPKGKAR